MDWQKRLADAGIKFQIEALLSEDERKQIDEVYVSWENVTWFEAFSIWALEQKDLYVG